MPHWRRGQDLGHRRHAHRIPAQQADGADFGRCFKLWTSHIKIYAAAQRYAKFFRRVRGQLLQPGRIGPAEIEEPLAKSGERRAPGRAVGEELEVIGDEHEIPHPEAFVDPAGCIGDQQLFHLQQVHHPHIKGNGLHRIALVVVEAPRHDRRRSAVQAAQHQPAGRGTPRWNGENAGCPRRGWTPRLPLPPPGGPTQSPAPGHTSGLSVIRRRIYAAASS